jgi:hypothetical protein
MPVLVLGLGSGSLFFSNLEAAVAGDPEAGRDLGHDPLPRSGSPLILPVADPTSGSTMLFHFAHKTA